MKYIAKLQFASSTQTKLNYDVASLSISYNLHFRSYLSWFDLRPDIIEDFRITEALIKIVSDQVFVFSSCYFPDGPRGFCCFALALLGVSGTFLTFCWTFFLLSSFHTAIFSHNLLLKIL